MEKSEKKSMKRSIKELESRFAMLQQQLKTAKVPVIITFDGWGASGKGTLIGKMILNLDPRGFEVCAMDEADAAEKRYPFLYRYWLKLPAKGEITIFDRSWNQEISVFRVDREKKHKCFKEQLESVLRFERQLCDDGAVLLKFFLNISKKEQAKRFEKLLADKTTAWRVTDLDIYRNEHYDEYARAFDEMIEKTETDHAPWHLIDACDKDEAYYKILECCVETIETKMKENLQHDGIRADQMKMPLLSMPLLQDVDLSLTIDDETYKEELKKAQKKLRVLSNELYLKKIPLILCYEGWDAAGKGGNIKRLAACFDPRGYNVNPTSAPNAYEASHHYLWRFWRHLPKSGHIAVFDRTWYGRVMVERIEGFCNEQQWRRAYNEINEFEQDLSRWGAVILKFWLQIDKDEQLKRFEERQNTPEKQWKITDEDWRNREKWDQYEPAVNEMLRLTSTTFAPWMIIESNSKEYARLKTIYLVIEAIENRLNQKE